MTYPVFTVFDGDVVPILFATYDGGTGASITMTGLAVTDIEIYKDGGVTQRASDAGYTLLDTDGIDFDTHTGIHGFSIDTGDNTDAGFYTVGSWFTVVVASVTVDAQVVNFIAAQFRIMKAESVAGVPKADVDAWLGTAAATPTTAGVPEVDITHWKGTAAATVDTAGYPVVTIKDGTGAGEINTLSGAVVQVDQLGTQAKADVNAEVLDVLNTDTFAEPGQGTPAATTTLVAKIGYLYKAWRNRHTQTASEYALYADDATTKDQEAIVTDDGTTYDRGEVSTGA